MGERTLPGVPAQVTEAVEGMEGGGVGDDGLGGELEPLGEVGEGRDDGGRVEGDSESGEDEVANEEGVDTCAERGSARGIDAGEGRGEGAPTERPAPVARLAMEVMAVSWGW